MNQLVLSICFVFAFSWIQNAHSAPPPLLLSLENYLSQVKGAHSGLKGSNLSTESGKERSSEAQLLLAPTVFFNASMVSDARLPQFSFFGYDRLNSQTFSLGVSKQTTFGLLAKLKYDLFSQEYINPIIPAGLGAGGFTLSPTYAIAAPTLELTQSLWTNGFGSSTRATQEQLEAQALSSSYQASFNAKTTLTKAESSYWQLVVARELLIVQNEAMNRAVKTYDYTRRRTQLNLAEDSDFLQAEANLEMRKLDLESARNEEKIAARAFNSSRSIDYDQVKEELTSLDPDILDRFPIPTRAKFRDDVIAAEQTAKATQASAKLAVQRNLPVLDLNASFTLNGQQGYSPFATMSQSVPASFTLNRPSYTFGLKFSMPLNFGLVHDSNAAWAKEIIANDLNYERKLFEQEQEWRDLNQNLLETKKRLVLIFKLEKIQQAKMEAERKRLLKGRSTTYQVLLFEQDYLLALLSRVREQSRALSMITQMKLFGETL